MDIIQKKLCLEPFISRFYSKHPYINEGGEIVTIPESDMGNWGYVHTDIVISSGNTLCNIKNKIPFIQKDENYNYYLRYGTMIKWYSWINDFFRTTNFFISTKNNEFVLSSINDIDVFDSRYTTSNLLFCKSTDDLNINNINCNDIIGINDSADIFNSVFRISGDTTRYEVKFIELVNNCFAGNNGGYSIPYISISIYMDSDYDDCGILTPYSSYWDPHKTYTLGDIVSYNGEENKGMYVLTAGTHIEYVEITGVLYDKIYTDYGNAKTGTVSGSPYYVVNGDINIAEKEEEYLFEGGKRKVCRKNNSFYFPIIVLKNNSLFFNPNNGYWKQIYETTSSSKDISATTRSRLEEVRCTKQSVDDNGNNLPFLIPIKTFIDKNGKEQLVQLLDGDTIFTDIPFKVGITYSMLNDDKTFTVNSLDKITITFNNKNTSEVITSATPINYKTHFYKKNDSGDILIGDTGGTITFEYTIGGYKTSNSNNINGGIKYNETYDWKCNTLTGLTIDGCEDITCCYIDILYENNSETISVETTKIGVENETKNVIFSNINYKGEVFDDSDPYFTSFKKIDLLGIEDIHEDIEIDLDRGNSSVFERLNILGEVNSFNDLKNYRNNYFGLE
jgi:hypothetical protein